MSCLAMNKQMRAIASDSVCFKSNFRHPNKAKYGITSKQYDELFASQGYKCAVCNCTQNNGYGKMPVDHCHTTGKVRAILCQSCNVTLGKVEEKEEILLALIEYLRKHKGEYHQDFTH